MTIDWAALVGRTIHPAKVAIIEALHWVGSPLSATELSEVLKEGDFSFDSVHYHLGALAKLGVAEATSIRPAQGGRERHYVLSRSN